MQNKGREIQKNACVKAIEQLQGAIATGNERASQSGSKKSSPGEKIKRNIKRIYLLTETGDTALESGGVNERRLIGTHWGWAPEPRCTVRWRLAAGARERTLGVTGLAVALLVVALTASSESVSESRWAILRSRAMMQVFSCRRMLEYTLNNKGK